LQDSPTPRRTRTHYGYSQHKGRVSGAQIFSIVAVLVVMAVLFIVVLSLG
jgi:hypothetical protein